LTTYTVTCELFTYSFEDINTGVDAIDEVEEKRKYNMYAFQLSGAPISGSMFTRNDVIYQVAGLTGAGLTYANATAEATVVQIAGSYAYMKGLSGTFATGPSGTESIKSSTTDSEYYLLNYDVTNVNLSIDPVSGVDQIENDLYAEAADTELNFNRDTPFSEECQ
jgi:hypothetical protein